MPNKYEFKTATGEVCCSSNNPDHLCEHCKAALREAEGYAAPDGYAAALRAAAEKQPETFEQRWKQERLAQFQREWVQ